MGWVIDTCIWVDIERKTLVPNDVERFTGRDPVYMSPVTVAELSAGVENTPGSKCQSQAAGRPCAAHEKAMSPH